MKQYTQADFDKFEINEYGIRVCPSGDYTRIKSFGAGCSFGYGCTFGEGCRFGAGCTFEGLRFDKQPYFIRVNNIGSRGDGCIIYNSVSGIHVRSGCWFGTRDEFIARVQSVHGGSKYAEQYITAIKLAEITF